MLDENSFDGEFEETPLLDSTHLNDMQKKVTAIKCKACDYKTHNGANLRRHHMTVHGKSKTKQIRDRFRTMIDLYFNEFELRNCYNTQIASIGFSDFWLFCQEIVPPVSA